MVNFKINNSNTYLFYRFFTSTNLMSISTINRTLKLANKYNKDPFEIAFMNLKVMLS
jgi:hypothetical protein